MGMFSKQGSPFLYDDDTKDIVGISDPDGSYTPILSTPEVMGWRTLSGVSTIGAVGDSIVAGSPASIIGYATQMYFGSPVLGAQIKNAAVAGTRTDQIASQIPGVLASGCNPIYIDGLVNDIVQGVSQNTRRENMAANIQTIISAARRPIVQGLPPTNTSGNVPAYVTDEIWLRLWCYRHSVQKIDLWSPLATSLGAYVSGVNYDSVHPNWTGAALCAPELISAIASPQSRTSYPLIALHDTASVQGSFIGNQISMTDTNADGVPDGWNGTNLSIIAPAASDKVFGKWLRATLSAASGYYHQPTAVTLASLGWAIGDKIAFGARVRTSSGITSCKIIYTGISVDNQPLYLNSGSPSPLDMYVYMESTITAGTLLNISFMADGTGTFDVAGAICVNLTKMGL